MSSLLYANDLVLCVRGVGEGLSEELLKTIVARFLKCVEEVYKSVQIRAGDGVR